MTTRSCFTRSSTLSDDQELPALEALEGVRAAASSAAARRVPASWAVGDSAYNDTSENVDAVLAEGFGLSSPR